MPRARNTDPYDGPNLGARALDSAALNFNLSRRQIAQRCGLKNMPLVSEWARGVGRPADHYRIILERELGVPRELWDQNDPDWVPIHQRRAASPPPKDREAVRARLVERAAEAPPEPPTIDEQIATTLGSEGTADPKAIMPAINATLRVRREEVDAAIGDLSDRDRITGRQDFEATRTALLAVVSAWPRVAQALLPILASPKPEGAFGALQKVRADLEYLISRITDHAQRVQYDLIKVDRYFARRHFAEQLLAKARLNDDPAKLLNTRAWREIVGTVGDVLRATPGALEAVQIGFDEPSPFGVALLGQVATVRHITWPATQFQNDPVGFVRIVLGVDPEPLQIKILESVRDNARTSVASGRRVGKTDALAMVALWYYSCFAHARVFITAPTERQVERVDWIAIRRLHVGSGVCLSCRKRERDEKIQIASPCIHSAKLDGNLAEKAKTGLRSEDLREISGFTSKTAEAVQGLAGANIGFIADEASGVDDLIFEAIEGNLSGGGRMLLTGNPTRNAGEHYQSFFAKKKFYNSFRASSLESSNCIEGRAKIPGLATREWIEQMREMHGEDSAYFKIHVLGEHAIGEDGRLISLHLIGEAEERWHTAPDEGDLFVGLDPAGASGEGDESTFAVRRGQKLIELIVRRGLDDDGHLSVLLEIIKRHRRDRERTVCVVDIEGVGSGTSARLRQYAATQPEVLVVFGVKSSAGAMREPQIYERVRDELGANFTRWLKHGGAIPTDIKLAAEIHALEMKTKITAKGERVKLIPKDELRKILRRSPDRYDACALACWEPSTLHETSVAAPPERDERRPLIDPYGTIAGNSAGEIDPYDLA